MASRPDEILTMDRLVYEFVSSDGTGAADKINMAVNGSTPVEFYVGPAAGDVWAMQRVIFHLEDDTGVNLYPENFGALSALTNGCLFVAESDGTTVVDFTRNKPIKSNADFGHFAYDVTYQTGAQQASAPANGTVQSRFTFTKGSNEILLYGDTTDRIVVTIQDNLSTLIDFSAQVQGRRII